MHKLGNLVDINKDEAFFPASTVPLMLVRKNIFLVTGFFFRTSLGNPILCTGQSRVTGNWVSFGLIRVCGELSKSDVTGEKLPVLPPG